MAEKKKEITLEEAFGQLEETMQALEAEDITLEDAFLQYKQGMELLKHCNDLIDKVEKRVLVLSEDGECHEF